MSSHDNSSSSKWNSVNILNSKKIIKPFVKKSFRPVYSKITIAI
ncbi:hypothetical protein FKJ83_13705 [Klebsiella pneumoniae]|nr:hypothetical protein [Klebsiella pneumoniae]MBK3278944.1 hypothetical protein [Klebsiella pneumoniae]